MDLSVLLSDAFDVLKNLRDGELLAGLALLINMLVNLTKLPVLKTLFDKFNWAKPLMALGLGLAGGLVQALVDGKPVGEVVVVALTGATAGIGAVGFHELVRALKVIYASVKGKFTA